MHDYLRLLRPKQWIKNVFVFPPLIFSIHFLNISDIQKALLAFVAFCLASSCVYIMNDIFDREADAKHPVKKNRPLASGAVSLHNALFIIFVLLFLSALIILQIPQIVYPLLGYVILNIFYNLSLKHIPIVDIFSIAVGFVLRVVVGTVAIAVPSSDWMLLTVMALALFLASVKRRQELVNQGVAMRKSLSGYNVAFLDKCIVMFALSSFIFYTLYVALKNPVLIYTPIVVLFCLLRYMLIINDGKGEDPSEDLFKDKLILLGGIFWSILVIIGMTQNQ